jgi:predicted nucleic acid-binding protein
MSNKLLIADTSLLINFLNVDRIDLIANHKPRCAITEHVMAEVNGSYPAQTQRLAAALAGGHLERVATTEDAELELFAKLQSDGRLGAGECSAIAVALNRGHALAIDDRLATREARARATAMGVTLSVYSTRDIIVRLIKAGHLPLGQADILLVEWRSQHRFELGIRSFAEFIR